MRSYIAISLVCACALLLESCGSAKYTANAEYPVPKVQYAAEGTLQEVFFPSSEPGMTSRHAYVYLPKEYSQSSERFPVLYLLHGARGNECVWMEKGRLLQKIDSLCACGDMRPTIVVLPNLNQYNDAADYGNARLKGALESFFEVDGTVESHFVSDVVAGTDSLFRTIPDKEHRAVAGLSIGAMQSIWLSANSPDVFDYVGAFSPMVRSFTKRGPDRSFYRKLSKKQEVQFATPPKLYIVMIGRIDFFHLHIAYWTRSLKRKGYPCSYVCTAGGHEWNTWQNFCCEFMKKLWKD